MKKLTFLIVLLLFSTLGLTQNIEREEIQQALQTVAQGVNSGDAEVILSVFTSEAQAKYRTQIRDRIEGKNISYQIDILWNNLEKRAEPAEITIPVRYAASGIGWNISGLKARFTFKNERGKWFVDQTDFHERIGAEAVAKMVGKMFAIMGPLFLAGFGFWLWMLIDCAKRDFPVEYDKKAFWIVMLVLFNWIAMLVYFFKVKRRFSTRHDS